MEHTKTPFSIAFRGLGAFIFALILTLATPLLEQPSFAQAADRPSDVLGMAWSATTFPTWNGP